MARGAAKRRPSPVGPGPWRTCVGCRAVMRPDDPEAGLVRFVRAESASSVETAAGGTAGVLAVPSASSPSDQTHDVEQRSSADSRSLNIEVSRHGAGRGAWICRVVLHDGTEAVKPSCFAAATKRHAFAKALRITK